MRALKPISFSPSHNRLKNVSALERAGAGALPLAHRSLRRSISAYNCRPNSWLSSSDANLLLRQQTSSAMAQRNYARAIELLNRLIAYEPQDAEHYANRGLMHYYLESLEQALADYDQALCLNPELDKAYNNRANLYATLKDWTAAIADYDCALDLNPLNIRARINQAITFREMGECEEALACLDIALFFTPASTHLYAVLCAERGRTYHLQGEWNCAIAEYDKALAFIQSASSTGQSAGQSASDSASDAVSDLAGKSRAGSEWRQNEALMGRILKWMGSFY
jgi:tetratricopeptide (TPR) repeat protein